MTAEAILAWCIMHNVDLHFSCLRTVILFTPGLPAIERKTLEECIQEAQRMMAVEGTLVAPKQLALLEERKV
jgi:hypothetical protein